MLKMQMRCISTVVKFANKPITPITLQALMNNDLLSNAKFISNELPIRLARRVQAFEQLPFIVGTNPHVKKCYEMYLDAFEKLAAFPPVDQNLEEFTQLLTQLVDEHSDVISILSTGIAESVIMLGSIIIQKRKYLSKQTVTRFLNEMIHARIGIRALAEQQIQMYTHKKTIVNNNLSPVSVLEPVVLYAQELCELNFGSYPEVKIIPEGDTFHTAAKDITFPYIEVHLHYILFELLKNAMRATVEFSKRINRRAGSSEEYAHPPIEITIGQTEQHICVRIRDGGGGIDPKHRKSIWEYAYTTVNEQSADDNVWDGSSGLHSVSQMGVIAGSGGPMAGLGYGLPMTRIYAMWAGGSLNLVSMDYHGCDVLLRLPNIKSVGQRLQV